jgi:hypothetical protein
MRTVISGLLLAAAAAIAPSASFAEDVSLPKAEPGQCVVELRNPHCAPQPHAAKADAPDVLKSVERIVKAYSSGNLPEYESLLDEDCSYLDHERNKMISGKARVIEHLKQSFAKHAPNGTQPLVSYTVDQPYIKVLGETAVVTYRAFEEIGGATPMHAEGLITKIFRKSGDTWKQQYDSSSWHAK